MQPQARTVVVGRERSDPAVGIALRRALYAFRQVLEVRLRPLTPPGLCLVRGCVAIIGGPRSWCDVLLVCGIPVDGDAVLRDAQCEKSRTHEVVQCILKVVLLVISRRR